MCRRIRGLMVFSHSISIATKRTVGGIPFGWEEITPGSDNDPCPWRVFLETCQEIGYDGYLSHEQCSPMIVKGHRIADLDDVDRRYREALRYLKGLALELDYYTGHRRGGAAGGGGPRCRRGRRGRSPAPDHAAARRCRHATIRSPALLGARAADPPA